MDEPSPDTASNARTMAWRACVFAAACLVVLAFSPLVLAPGEVGPIVFGLPRTLWSSMLIALALIVVTAVGALVHPGREDADVGS